MKSRAKNRLKTLAGAAAAALAALLAPATLPAQAPASAPASQPAASPALEAVHQPLLWVIEGETPSYLFGTIHLPDKRVVDTLPDEVHDAMDAADAVYTEIPMDPMTTGMAAGMSMSLMGPPLSERIGPELQARVAAVLERRGLSPTMLDQFKTWAAAATLGTLDYLEQMAAEPPLDMMIYQRAEKAGKKVAGIETLQEQMGVFEAFTDEEQVKFLEMTLDGVEEADRKGEKPTEKILQAYLLGDAENIHAIAMEEFDHEDPIGVKFMHKLLTERDLRMAERISAKLAEEPGLTHFFAVGAMHLAGDSSVIAHLERMGHTIHRVEAAAPAAATH